MAETHSEPTEWAARDGVAVVVGGTGGIGAAVTRKLSARGARVAFTYHKNDTAAQALVAEHEARWAPVVADQLDAADPQAARDYVASVVERFGRIHTVVVAAAPPVPMRYLSQVSAEQLRDQLYEDAAALFNVVGPAIPALRTSSGCIVAVTTAATRRFPPRDGLSAAPKGAVEALVRALAVEEGRYGVRANCVGPGMLTDGLAERLIASGELGQDALEEARRNTPLHRFGAATDVAEAVCFLASPRAGFITGQKLDVDGGYTT